MFRRGRPAGGHPIGGDHDEPAKRAVGDSDVALADVGSDVGHDLLPWQAVAQLAMNLNQQIAGWDVLIQQISQDVCS